MIIAYTLAVLLFIAARPARGVHHLYWGLLVGVLASFSFPALHILGLYLVWDDAIQHARQRWRDPQYLSPLTRIVVPWLYRIPGVQRFNEWLDAL